MTKKQLEEENVRLEDENARLRKLVDQIKDAVSDITRDSLRDELSEKYQDSSDMVYPYMVGHVIGLVQYYEEGRHHV